MFYDVTTLYFESVMKDTLRNFGFSKDQKINEVQIVLGLANEILRILKVRIPPNITTPEGFKGIIKT